MFQIISLADLVAGRIVVEGPGAGIPDIGCIGGHLLLLSGEGLADEASLNNENTISYKVRNISRLLLFYT